MAILFHCPWENAPLWLAELRRADPGLDIRIWPEIGPPADIDFALVWELPSGVLKTLPNLRCISSLGAGIDHVLVDPERPRHVPVCRLLYPEMVRRMTEYVLLAVLRYQRRLDEYAGQQRRRVWQILPMKDAADLRVGVMGLGALGRDAVEKLAFLGYDTAGWNRSPRDIPGVACFAGRAALPAFLARTDILVNLLPLNAETRGIVDGELLAALPDGACLVNCGRGGHVVEADLLAALDSGRLAGATLDAFQPEPLDPHHPFWGHPRIIVTPHVSSLSKVPAAVAGVLENIRRVRAGLPPLHVVQPAE